MIPTLTPLKSTLFGFSLIRNCNLASALMEIFWIAISLPGILKGLSGATDISGEETLTRSNNEH